MATYQKTPHLSFVLALRTTSNVVVTAIPGDLNTIIGAGFSPRYPMGCTQVANSVVLLSNGIDPMQRWDANSGIMEFAGVPSPATVVVGTIIAGTASDQATSAFIYAFCRFYDAYGNVSDLSPVGAGVGGYSAVTIFAYSNVPVPTGSYASKVVGRQLLRNTPGQATVFYVDIDTPDITSTTFTSYHVDETLSSLLAVPLLSTSGAILANTHGFPPSWKSATAAYLGRVFATGEITYAEGNVSVTSYSNQVVGIGTNWPANFAGRHLFLANPSGEYEIQTVDVTSQTLTLTQVYDGPTDPFAIYGIRAPVYEWRNIYYTPSNQPESWPATYALSLQDDGDEITGLMQLGSFLYILERKHVYRLTFLNDPATDGAIFLSSRRGCLSQRMWVQAEATAYLFDQQGVHSFTGGNSVSISDPIQDLWRENSESPYVINWNADTSLWCCSCNAQYTTIRFFVAMTGSRYPYHALAYNYRQNRWWIEEYHRPICTAQVMTVGQIARTIAGLDCNNVVALDVGYIDGSRGISPTMRGTVAAITACSLTDPTAHFTDELLNLTVGINQGRGKGQVRRIIGQTDGGTRLVTETPWNITPAAGDTYLVGAIPWSWQPGWFELVDDAQNMNSRDVEVLFRPQHAGIANLELFYNRATTSRTWRSDRTGTATVTAGDPRVEIDLTDPSGSGVMRLEGHKERYITGDLYMSPALSGFQHQEPVRIYRVSLTGVDSSG